MDKELGERLTILETKYKERWDAHDERAGQLCKKVDKIKESIDYLDSWLREKFGNLQCKTVVERVRVMWWVLTGTWVAIGILVGLILHGGRL